MQYYLLEKKRDQGQFFPHPKIKYYPKKVILKLLMLDLLTLNVNSYKEALQYYQGLPRPI